MEANNPSRWEAQTILRQRKDGWEWESIRMYWLLLDNLYAFNVARRMQCDESKSRVIGH